MLLPAFYANAHKHISRNIHILHQVQYEDIVDIDIETRLHVARMLTK